ncbi:hypothetical protein J32TS6_12390 [Virgibacillus pantothenticus]|nr:hypothetical protein J32TS6_12390 [Virgibacillus pantothenticus]
MKILKRFKDRSAHTELHCNKRLKDAELKLRLQYIKDSVTIVEIRQYRKVNTVIDDALSYCGGSFFYCCYYLKNFLRK